MEAVVITTGVKHSCQNPWSVTIMDPNQENGRVELKVMCPKVNPLTVCAQNVPISIEKNNIIDLIFFKVLYSACTMGIFALLRVNGRNNIKASQSRAGFLIGRVLIVQKAATITKFLNHDKELITFCPIGH